MCVHHYLLESPNHSSLVQGTCKKCGDQKLYPAYEIHADLSKSRVRHGTLSAYILGCRCDLCKVAGDTSRKKSIDSRQRQARLRAALRGKVDIVPLDSIDAEESQWD